MPDLKISALPAAATPDGTEVLAAAQAGTTTGITAQAIADMGGATRTLGTASIDGGVVVLDANDAQYWAVLATASGELQLTASTTGGTDMWVMVTQDGVGGHDVILPDVTWDTGSAPTPDTSAGQAHLYRFVSLDGAVTWRGSVGPNNYVTIDWFITELGNYTDTAGVETMITDAVAAITSTPTPINAQTGDYTLTADDRNGMVFVDSAVTPTVVTVPAGLNWVDGDRVDIMQFGNGQVEIDASAVSFYGTSSVLAGLYSAASLVTVGPDTYILVGDLGPA